MKKIDILDKLYKKKISQEEADATYVNVFDKYNRGILKTDPIKLLCLSHKENIAIRLHKISFGILAKWRYEGWPKTCAICGKPVAIGNVDWCAFERKKIGGKVRSEVIMHGGCYSAMPASKRAAQGPYEIFDRACAKAPDEQLIRLLARFKKKDYLTTPIIFDLICAKRIKILKLLHEQHVPFSYLASSGGNALHAACGISGSLEAVKFLIENNILTDINAKCDNGETPFLLAVMYNHMDIVEYFFEHFTPNVTISTLHGDTPLSLAKKNGNEMIYCLIKAHLPETNTPVLKLGRNELKHAFERILDVLTDDAVTEIEFPDRDIYFCQILNKKDKRVDSPDSKIVGSLNEDIASLKESIHGKRGWLELDIERFGAILLALGARVKSTHPKRRARVLGRTIDVR